MKFFLMYMLLPLCCASLFCKAQPLIPKNAFASFVSKTYRLPAELKYNCGWMYAIVKIKTDSKNKITSFDFVNAPPASMRSSFAFLKGYRFPKSMIIKRHPIVFYLSVDNQESCRPKNDDLRFYAPNRVVEIISYYIQKILKQDPHTIIIPDLIIEKILPDQE